MTSEELARCDENADLAIKVMIGSIVTGAVIPAAINWTVVAAAMGTGCVAIGKCYGFNLTRKDGWKLVKQFILGAGFMFLALNIGSKVIATIAQATGIGYAAGVVLDGVIFCGSSMGCWRVCKRIFSLASTRKKCFSG